MIDYVIVAEPHLCRGTGGGVLALPSSLSLETGANLTRRFFPP